MTTMALSVRCTYALAGAVGSPGLDASEVLALRTFLQVRVKRPGRLPIIKKLREALMCSQSAKVGRVGQKGSSTEL